MTIDYADWIPGLQNYNPLGLMHVQIQIKSISNYIKFMTLTLFQFDADVVGCTRNPANDMVTVLDTYNDLSPTRNNIRDDTQDVVLLNSSFINGTISCT